MMGDGQVESVRSWRSTPREARCSVFVPAVGGPRVAADQCVSACDGLCLSLQQLVLGLRFNGFP